MSIQKQKTAKHPAKLTVMYVPNTAKGKAFIKQMKQYMNYASYTVACRGRGNRTKAAKAEGFRNSIPYQAHLPLKYATTLAVYFRPKGRIQMETKDWQELIGKARQQPCNHMDTIKAIKNLAAIL